MNTKDADLDRVASYLNHEEWKSLGRKLGMTDPELNRIEHEENYRNIRETCYRMLLSWKQQNGINAKKQVLVSALKDLPRVDILRIIFPDSCSAIYILPEDEIDPLKIEHLSKTIGINWKAIGRTLQFTENELILIEHEKRFHGISETFIHMIEKYKKKHGFYPSESLFNLFIHFHEDRSASELHIEERSYSSWDLSIIPIEDKVTVTNMSEKQRKRYINIGVPNLSWIKRVPILKELYVDLSLISKGTLREDQRRKIELEAIFDGIDQCKINRIYIEAGPGFGKTTLASKLLFDWADGREYIANRYVLVFIIPLREYQGNVEEFLKKQMEMECVSAEERMNLLATIQQKCLLILDGYDELNDKLKKTIDPLLTYDMYPLMTVLMTSRPGHYKITEMNDNEFENVTSWCKHIFIEGIPVEKRNDFIQKYVQVDGTELFEKIDRLSKNELTDLYQCPLFLILIATLLQEDQVEQIISKTDLYKKVFNFIIKRSIQRNTTILRRTNFNNTFLSSLSSYDVFLPINTHSIIDRLLRKPEVYLRNLFIKLGKFSLSLLKENRLIFSETEIVTHFNKDRNVLNLGFFISNSKYCFKVETFYEPVHKTFTEFLTAIYLTELFFNSSKSKQKFISEIVCLLDCGLEPNRYSLLFSFLVGLLGDNAIVLFEVLTTKCLLHAETLVSIFKEMAKTEELIQFFVNFLPEYYVVDRDDDPFLSVGLKLGRIKVVEYHMNYSVKLGEGTKVEILILCNDLINDKGLNSIPYLRISCKKLIARYETTSMYPYGTQLLKHFSVSKGIYIFMHADNRETLGTILKFDSALKINHLFISYEESLSSYSEYLMDLISINGVVENLILLKYNGFDSLKKYNDENHLNCCSYCTQKSGAFHIPELSLPLFELPCSIPPQNHSCLFIRGKTMIHFKIWKGTLFVNDLQSRTSRSLYNALSTICVSSDIETSSNPSSDFIELISSLSTDVNHAQRSLPFVENDLQLLHKEQSQKNLRIFHPLEKLSSLKCSIDFLNNLFELKPRHWKLQTVTFLDLSWFPENYFYKLCEELPHLKCIVFPYYKNCLPNFFLSNLRHLTTVRTRFYRNTYFNDFLEELRIYSNSFIHITSSDYCLKELQLEFISKIPLNRNLTVELEFFHFGFSFLFNIHCLEKISFISQHESDIELFSDVVSKDEDLTFHIDDDLNLFNLKTFDMNFIQMKKVVMRRYKISTV